VFLVAIVAAAPLKDAKHSLAEIATHMAVGGENLIGTIREIVTPLTDDVRTRYERLSQTEEVQAAPLRVVIVRLNTTVTETEGNVTAVRARIEAIPSEITETSNKRDAISTEVGGLRQSLSDMETSTATQLREFQDRIDEAETDSVILSKLLEWLDKGHGDQVVLASIQQSFENVQSRSENLAPLVNILAQLSHRTHQGSSNDTRFVDEVREMIGSVHKAVLTTKAEAEGLLSNLTTSFAAEKARVLGLIRNGDDAFSITEQQISALQREKQRLLETEGQLELALGEAKQELQAKMDTVAEIEKQFVAEKQQLQGILETTQKILFLISSLGGQP